MDKQGKRRFAGKKNELKQTQTLGFTIGLSLNLAQVIPLWPG